MTPEEYQRLKEAEKEHLRKLKQLKQAVRELERQKRVTKAVEGITDTPRAVLDENADLVDQLAMETARSEARLEIALESAAERGDTVESQAERDARMDEELRKARARQLVDQMRGESATATPSEPAAAKKEAEESSKPKLPEKTIGRMKP